MSGTEELNYPPEELVQPSKLSRRNTEHIILWLLNNNEIVEWAAFLEDPISIPQSTLSNYINKLDSKGYIEKVKRGYYKITPKGEDRFNELSRAKETVRKLNFPPKVIRDGRNYDHIILWMAYNNNYLKWSDFTDEGSPVRINQSSLSKNLNILLDSEFIKKNDNKEYKITRAGKSQYARVLKLYDLDRQSILNEESKRIEEITKRTVRFFQRFKIDASDIKFRFLNYVLTLPYERLRGSLDNEEDFNKILLYLSINHPNQYPDYISTEDFSKQYDINQLDLEFNVRRIVEKDIYSHKFFKLEDGEKVYYFQANEKIEKVLSAITEDYITKFTYLNKLYEKIRNITPPPLTLELTVESILNEICDNLFDLGLKEALRKFLPEYINYLAYKIETERKLEEISDKLEGTIWQEFQYYSSSGINQKTLEESQENYYLYPHHFELLEQYYITSKIQSIVKRTKALLNQKKYEKALALVNSKIDSGLKGIEIQIFKAIILCYKNKFIEAIQLIEEGLGCYEQHKDDERIFMACAFILTFSYTALGTPKKALKVIEKMFELYPEHPISYAAKTIVYGYSVIYDFDVGIENDDYALELVDETINIDPNVLNKARHHQFKSTILEQMYKYDEALEEIDLALELEPDVVDFYYSKTKLLTELGKVEEALEILEENMDRFPKSKKHLLMQKAYIFKKMGDLEAGLQIVDKLIEELPNEYEFYNSKAYWHVYIYKEKKTKGIIDEEHKDAAIKAIEFLTEKVPDEGNYFDSYGEILLTTGDYENSIKKYKKAIEIDPNGWYVPASYLGLGKAYEKLGDFDKAIVNLEKARDIVRYCFCHIKHKKEWIDEIEYHQKKVEELKETS